MSEPLRSSYNFHAWRLGQHVGRVGQTFVNGPVRCECNVCRCSGRLPGCCNGVMWPREPLCTMHAEYSQHLGQVQTLGPCPKL